MNPAKLNKEVANMTKSDKQMVIALLEAIKAEAEKATDVKDVINALERVQSVLMDS